MTLDGLGAGAVLLLALVLGLALVLLLALVVLERIGSTVLAELRTVLETDILSNLLHLMWRFHDMPSLTSRQLFPQLLILILHTLIHLLMLFL
jgi:hypothetical protein